MGGRWDCVLAEDVREGVRETQPRVRSILAEGFLGEDFA